MMWEGREIMETDNPLNYTYRTNSRTGFYIILRADEVRLSPDEVSDGLVERDTLKARLAGVEAVVKAASNWDRAHPNIEGHCDNDDLRMCVTARALKEALLGGDGG